MIKKLFFCFYSIFFASWVFAQQVNLDSLKIELTHSTNDTASLFLLAKITDSYSEINFDSVYVFAEKMLAITKKLNLRLEETSALNNIAYALMNKGNYSRSLQYYLSTIAIGEDPASEKNILSSQYPFIDEFSDRNSSPRLQRLSKLSRTIHYTGILYFNAGNYNKALDYYRASLPVSIQTGNYPMLSVTYSTMGRTFLAMKNNDSALYYLRKAREDAQKVNYNRYIGSILLNLGRAHLASNERDSALYYFKLALIKSRENNYFRGVAASNLAIADIYKQQGVPDSSLFYIRKAWMAAYDLSAPDLFLRSYRALADYYKNIHNNDSAVKYQQLVIQINDSIFNSQQSQQFQNIGFDEQQRMLEIEKAKEDLKNRNKTNALLAGAAVFLLLALILYRNNRQKQKANKVLEKTLTNLKSTQAQLIQSEKMASLGELTAGIAHEIQNPLNFVNNFSEVNTELIDEMQKEMDKGNFADAKAISNDIKENEQKINHHGNRAADIVKGMLQHSRSSSGVKEPTNINALTDEYLRLSYHGLRAKDKSFKATLKTDFDNSIGNINIIPQDIGRVLLNLINNAFYATGERRKTEGEGFEPTVSISTSLIHPPSELVPNSLRESRSVQIKVSDNGNGIPQKIVDKIFQPFFTTKPTGQGTGLGLSLSYDIVKAHGGEIKVETKEGEGSEFVISLPV